MLFVLCVLKDNLAGESIFYFQSALGEAEKQNTFLDILTVRLVVDFDSEQLNKPHHENHNRVELLPSFDLG